MQIRSPFVSNKKALNEMKHSLFSQFIGAFSNRTKRDYSAMLNDPTSSSLIMAVILWIVRRWPEAPIYLENGKGDAIYDHAMLKLLNRPNPNYSGSILWFGVIMSLVWDGNGYMVKVRNKRTLAVEQIWYVPHFMIGPMVNSGSSAFVDYYQYAPGNASIIKLDPADVIHLRYGIDPYNMRKGMSPLRSIARDAVTDEEADNFAASMLHNMGVPGLLMSPDAKDGMPLDIDPDATKKYIKEHTTGDNRGEAMVFKGPWKIEQFGFDPKAMDLSTLRGIPEERVSAVTGIPSAVVGFGSGLKNAHVGATMKELREMAYEDGIIPIQRLVSPELETQLLDDFVPNPDEWTVKFDLSVVRVLQDDQDALYKRTIDAWNGGLISRAQGKQALGYDALPTDEIRRVPFSTTEVNEGEPLPPPMEFTLPAKSRAAETKGRRNIRERAFNELQLKYEERHRAVYASELSDGFSTIADKVVKAYEEHIANTSLRARKPGATKADPIDPNSIDGIGLSVEAGQIVTAASVTPLLDDLAWKAHYIAVAQSTLENMNGIFGIALDLPDLVQREILSKGGKHIALVDVTKQTQDAVFKALTEGRSAGLGPREIARAIRSEVEGRAMYPGVYKEAHDRAILRGWSEEKAAGAGDKAARQYRAEVISRTETKYAQNVSTLEMAKGAGTFNAILAFDSQHGSFDEECDERNGQIYSFEQSQIELDSEHPNFTLSFSPTIVQGPIE